MGTDGIDYMFQATEGLPIDVRFMLPSCVPATPMDESGANLDYRAIDSFYDYPRVQGLAEMMNAYGVIHNDKEVVSKIVAAQAHHKKIDGHAPRRGKAWRTRSVWTRRKYGPDCGDARLDSARRQRLDDHLFPAP